MADVTNIPEVKSFSLRALVRALVAFAFKLICRVWDVVAPIVAALSIVGFLAVMLMIDWLRPIHNWDTLAYLGVVARDWLGMADPQAIHAYAYDTVRAAVSPEAYAELIQMDDYRLRQFNDPAAFNSMLGMYDVKWGYVALLALLGPLVGAYEAGFVINALAATILATSLIWWFTKNELLPLAFVAPALMMISNVVGFGTADIPDFLAFALIVSGVLLLDQKHELAGLLSLCLAVLVRPDTIAFLGVLMAMTWFFADRFFVKTAIAFGVSLLVYLVIKNAGTHPGWWVHVWFSTYRYEHTLEGFDPGFSVIVYVTGFVWNLVRGALENEWLGIIALIAMGWGLMQRSGLLMSTRRTTLMAALLMGAVAKYVVFPIHDTRFYIALLFPAALILFAEAGLRLGALLKPSVIGERAAL
ncbi:MAG: hypothetical protein AAFR71_14615 [Pseudomonadota bacterium]